jgi:hypothetical protein
MIPVNASLHMIPSRQREWLRSRLFHWPSCGYRRTFHPVVASHIASPHQIFARKSPTAGCEATDRHRGHAILSSSSLAHHAAWTNPIYPCSAGVPHCVIGGNDVIVRLWLVAVTSEQITHTTYSAPTRTRQWFFQATSTRRIIANPRDTSTGIFQYRGQMH